MDNKTCMILLLGFIVVIVCSTNNSLEGLNNNIGTKMQKQITPVEYTLNNRNEMLNEHLGFKSDKTVLNNYDKTNDNIADISKNYPKLKDTTTYITDVNNANTIQIINENNKLQHKQYTTNAYLQNIDVSLEKVKNSGIVVTEYSYDTAIWAIIAVGLFIVTLTMIM